MQEKGYKSRLCAPQKLSAFVEGLSVYTINRNDIVLCPSQALLQVLIILLLGTAH